MTRTGLEAPPLAVSPDVVATIGETPLVDVSGLSPNPEVRILAKMECDNPTGSIKDRTARSLLDDAEARGVTLREAALAAGVDAATFDTLTDPATLARPHLDRRGR